MKRVHLFISGDVQGIGFRKWLKRQADALKLTGWVKNRDDGSIEAVAEGPADLLPRFIEAAKAGPMLAQVKDVQVTHENATGTMTEFAVVY